MQPLYIVLIGLCTGHCPFAVWVPAESDFTEVDTCMARAADRKASYPAFDWHCVSSDGSSEYENTTVGRAT